MHIDNAESLFLILMFVVISSRIIVRNTQRQTQRTGLVKIEHKNGKVLDIRMHKTSRNFCEYTDNIFVYISVLFRIYKH